MNNFTSRDNFSNDSNDSNESDETNKSAETNKSDETNEPDETNELSKFNEFNVLELLNVFAGKLNELNFINDDFVDIILKKIKTIQNEHNEKINDWFDETYTEDLNKLLKSIDTYSQFANSISSNCYLRFE